MAFRYIYSCTGAKRSEMATAADAAISVLAQPLVIEVEQELSAARKQALDTLLEGKGFEFSHQEEATEPAPSEEPEPEPAPPDPPPRDIHDDGVLKSTDGP